MTTLVRAPAVLAGRRPARLRLAVTTARFIPFGPARKGPRRPAVPNGQRPPKRSAKLGLGVRTSSSAGSSARRIGVGVVGEPGFGARALGSSQPRTDLGEQRAHPRGRSPRRPRAPRRGRAVSPVRPAARLVTSDRPSTSGSGLAGGDRLEHRRHADEVGAERRAAS